jgi:hypothetical protein
MRQLLTSDPALLEGPAGLLAIFKQVNAETHRVLGSMTRFGIEGTGKGHEVLSVETINKYLRSSEGCSGVNSTFVVPNGISGRVTLVRHYGISFKWVPGAGGSDDVSIHD